MKELGDIASADHKCIDEHAEGLHDSLAGRSLFRVPLNNQH